MSDGDFDEDAELDAENELFGEGNDAQSMEGDAGPAQLLERAQARHAAQVRGQLWGSEAGGSAASDTASEAAASSRRGVPGRHRRNKSFAAQGASEFYFGAPQPAGNPHWQQGGGRGSGSGVGAAERGPREEGSPREEGGDAPQQYLIAPNQCHVRYMPGFAELNGLALLGHGVNMKPMIFDHAATNSTGWVRFDQAGVAGSAPVRTMVVNIPAECWSTDASKFKDWQTPMNNSLRAASIAALLGLVMTPLSKGFMSGAHEEEVRAAAQDGQQADAQPRKPRDVRWYQMQSEEDHSMNIPMVVIGYEDLYDGKKETVLAIRVWLFVFDKTHSTSDLARKLMVESAQETAHSGAAHCQNALRKNIAVQHAKQTRGLLGTSLATAHLELVAGMCYRHITDLSVYKNLLSHYGGKTGDMPGKQPLDLTPDPENPNKFPRGLLNMPLLAAEELGCTHPLALEWVLNAKRPEALCAGLVHLDGTPMDVHPDQVAVTSYFDISAPANGDDSHVFTVPGWVGSDAGGDGKGCFFFQADPHKVNIFDMVLPHSIAGAIKPGPELMRLFKERFAPASGLADASPEMLNLFNNKMTGRDQWIQDQVASMTDTIVAFDTFDCSADERQTAIDAQKAAKRGIAHYGQMDGESHVVEPRQVLKEHAFATNNVHDKLVSPWASERRVQFASEETRIRLANGREHAKTPISDAVFAGLRREKEEFQERHEKIMREVVCLHLAKMERSFNSRMDKESIPAGYRAVWDGLQKELDDMPDRTANVAFGGMGVDKSGKCGMQLCDSDRSPFAAIENWKGAFFEDDCFIDGRDWRLMQELFLHCFEQFGEQTLLLIFCGPKGNGKTLRTERAMAAFVKGWITMSGPSSAKAGMQGNSDSSNGSNCVYDEMIDELTDGDGSNRTEYWKMILMKREYVYNKPVIVKGSDGREMHQTFKLLTPHQETHCVCTNRGPAFTKGKEDPTEVKSALIDRAVVQFVRTLGSKTHDDQEFEKNLMNPEVKCKMRAFRIMTCLMGLLKMLIFRQPYLKPDLALAQKLFDEWDSRLDCKYNLPKPSPRKNIKRLENLITMCCQNAVGHVFMFKQTAHLFDAGQTTPEFPKGKPFELNMLYECVQLLQPTREMIHQAWCMGLEYSIGTSSMGLNTLTVVAEVTGHQIGDWLNKPPEKDYAEYIQDRDSLIDLQAEHESQQKKDGAGGVAPRASRSIDPSKLSLPALTRIFAKANDTMTEDEVAEKRALLRARREARVEYQHRCSTSELQNVPLRDAQALADDCIGNCIGSMSLGPLPPRRQQRAGGAAAMEVEGDEGPREEGPRDEGPGVAEAPVPPMAPGAEFREQREDETMSEYEDDMPNSLRGQRAWTVNRMPPESFSPGDREMFTAYHHARCVDMPGAANCPFAHAQTFEMMSQCCYCKGDIDSGVAAGRANELSDLFGDSEDGGDDDSEAAPVATHLSLAASYVWPDMLEASMFYLPQTCVQWAAGQAAYVDPAGCTVLGTVPRGAAFGYKLKNSGTGGAQRVDIGWLQARGEAFKSWQSTALYIINRGSHTVKEFDFHPDGLRDCLYMCSTADNSRRCPEEPRLPMDTRPEKNVQTADGKTVGEHTVVLKIADYRLPNSGRVLGREHMHLPRHPNARIPDSNLQRRMDSMLHGGRLSALGILISNKVTNSPPIRMHQDGIEVNVAAMHAHMGLVAESVLACALVPGLRNMQEKLCNRQAGPSGLSAPRAAQRPVVGGKRRGDGSAKRAAEDAAALNPKLIHTLPYSYDVVGMALGIDMGNMLYDDVGEKAAEKCTQTHKARLGLDLKFENLPHLSTRFVGFAEDNRQTVSIKLDKARPADQEYVEAGDPDESESAISKAHVRRALGRNPTDSDMARYISRRQGARSMSGVRGDIFALSTWCKHTITTLKNRGLIRGAQMDTVVRCFLDMEHCIQARVAEAASVKKALPKFEKMDLDLAEPGTYAALEKQQATKRAVTEVALVEQQIDFLGFSAEEPMDYGLGEEEAPARPQRGRDCIAMGSGPEPDDE